MNIVYHCCCQKPSRVFRYFISSLIFPSPLPFSSRLPCFPFPCRPLMLRMPRVFRDLGAILIVNCTVWLQDLPKYWMWLELSWLVYVALLLKPTRLFSLGGEGFLVAWILISFIFSLGAVLLALWGSHILRKCGRIYVLLFARVLLCVCAWLC